MESYLYLAVVLALAISAEAFTWTDCGSDPDRPIKFHNLDFNPSTLKANAYNHVGFKITVERDIPEFAIKMKLKKKVLFMKIPAPCINGLGSCTYDNVCDVIWGEKDCPADVKAAGLPCSCPLKAGEIQSDGVQFWIPNFGKIVAALASGTYYFDAEITDKASGKQLGCLKIELSLKA